MDTLHRVCCGLDVHKDTVVACLRWLDRRDRVRLEVRTFGTTTGQLLALADWLAEHSVPIVAMESTGVYWKPIFNILEGQAELMLVNPEHIKKVPGRKTDVKDCEWIVQLLQHGLLKASFVPPSPIRELRDLTRQRSQLVGEKSAVANRIQKVLEDANIKLGSVATDVLGVSGRAMIGALIDGRTDGGELAELARGRLRRKSKELAEALTGHVNDHHRFMLRLHMDHLGHLADLETRLGQRIDELIGPPEGPHEGGPAEGGSTGRPGPSEQSERGPNAGPPGLASALGLLVGIPGISQRSAEVILAEIGTDMSRFPTAAQLASWAGLCPGNNQSAGKRRSGRTPHGDRWLRAALVQCAWAASRKKGSYLAARYHRLAKRRGKKKALIAVAHSLLQICYQILTTGRRYEDLGGDYLDKLQPQKRTKYLIKQLESLGHKVTLEPLAA